MGLPLWTWAKKTVHGVKTHWLSSKEKVPGAIVSKEDNADSLLGYVRTHPYLFAWKSQNCKKCYLLPTPLAKFSLFIEWPFYIYDQVGTRYLFFKNCHHEIYLFKVKQFH